MILVTGATGFVGSSLVVRLVREGIETRACVRRDHVELPEGVQAVRVDNLTAETDWHHALSGVEVVVHAAARVHVMQDAATDPLQEFRRVNVQGTLQLARQAAAAGVRRFVFISSIKVNGEATQPGHPFTADDAPAPLDAYGISKMEAEQGLRELAAQTGMELVIIRPPLVYGPGVKANFQAMMRWLARGMPLPFGAIHNQRSLVALDNLVDLIVTCIHHPAAANQTFLVSDGEDLSTSQLLRRMGQALGKPARLIPVPPALLKVGAASVGKPAFAQRLCGSLQVDISKTRQLLGWRPPVSVDVGLKKAAEGYWREASV
ncbi:SDR family oxidoreductase [Polaromonas sp. P1(28)-8]|nr:SDR family oxidoreductase [Polaromonas sp. P1(28)-8]